jgi:hypothetical protein
MIAKTRSDVISNVVTDGILEKDIPVNNWDSFVIKRPISYYEVTVADLQRPDLISTKIYGSQDYWWILLKYNEIMCVWDIKEGDLLKVPSVLDVESWLGSIK